VPGLTSKVRSARLLGGGTLKTESHEAGVIIRLPASRPDPVASVVAVEVDG
jgi:hypothetical protein